MDKMFKIIILAIIIVGFVRGAVVLAEPQFGGIVEELVYCDCTENWYVKVGDPHGGDYIKNDSTETYDCEPLAQGEWILGMSTENMEDCEIEVDEECEVVHSGEIIEYYGSDNCGESSSESEEESVEEENDTEEDSQENQEEVDISSDQDVESDSDSDSDDSDSDDSDDGDSESDSEDNLNSLSGLSSGIGGEDSNSGGSSEETGGSGIVGEINSSTGQTGEQVHNDGQANESSVLATQLVGGKKGEIKGINKLIQLIFVVIGLGVATYFIFRAIRSAINFSKN